MVREPHVELSPAHQEKPTEVFKDLICSHYLTKAKRELKRIVWLNPITSDVPSNDIVLSHCFDVVCSTARENQYYKPN